MPLTASYGGKESDFFTAKNIRTYFGQNQKTVIDRVLPMGDYTGNKVFVSREGKRVHTELGVYRDAKVLGARPPKSHKATRNAPACKSADG